MAAYPLTKFLAVGRTQVRLPSHTRFRNRGTLEGFMGGHGDGPFNRGGAGWLKALKFSLKLICRFDVHQLFDQLRRSHDGEVSL